MPYTKHEDGWIRSRGRRRRTQENDDKKSEDWQQGHPLPPTLGTSHCVNRTRDSHRCRCWGTVRCCRRRCPKCQQGTGSEHPQHSTTPQGTLFETSASPMNPDRCCMTPARRASVCCYQQDSTRSSCHTGSPCRLWTPPGSNSRPGTTPCTSAIRQHRMAVHSAPTTPAWENNPATVAFSTSATPHDDPHAHMNSTTAHVYTRHRDANTHRGCQTLRCAILSSWTECGDATGTVRPQWAHRSAGTEGNAH